VSAAAGAAGALIAAQAEQKHREIVAYFEEQGALDPAGAVALPADDRLARSVIDEMLGHGELIEEAADRYWLDRDRAALRQARIKRRAGRALTIVAAVAAAAAIAVLALR
jgi:hypothetical protein